MTTTVTTVSPRTSPSIATAPRARVAFGAIVRTGVVVGVVAAAATTLVAVGAKALGVPLEAAPQTADAAQAIPISGFAMGTLMCTAIGVVLALLLAWRTRRPARIFVAVTVVLTVVSFAGPATTGYATTATRLVLDLTHVVAALIVIPAIARTLAMSSSSPTV